RLGARGGDDVGGRVALVLVARGFPQRGGADEECECGEDDDDPAHVHDLVSCLAYMLPSVSMRFRAAGPRMMMKSVGKRKSASGMRSLTAAFCAACSARCRRFVRRLSA